MDSFRLDRSATVALAWIGDAEFTLFVREAFLYEGIRDQRYLNNFVSREAHARILFELRGVPVTRHLASEIFEAAFASDPTFRLTVEAYVVKHVRARTYPGGSGVALAWQCEAGRVVAPSAFARYQGGVPTFARAEGAWTETMGEEHEAGRLLGFTLVYRRLKRKVLGML